MTAAVDTPRAYVRASTEDVFAAIGTALPALLLVYLLIIWPFAFGDSAISIEEMAMGWMAQPAQKDDSILKIIAYPILFLIGAACFLLSSAYRRVPWLSGGVVFCVAFIAVAIASSQWSLIPSLTLQRAGLLAITTSIVFFAAFSAGSLRTMMTLSFWVLFVVALINVPALAIIDATPIGHSGIYPHKNAFGYVAFLVFAFGLFGLATGRIVTRLASLFMIAAGLLFLVVSQSKTSLGLAVLAPIAGTALFVFARHLKLPPAPVVALAVILAGLGYFAGAQSGMWTFATFNEAVFGNPSLTGRTEVWTFALDQISKRPLFGFGYEAVWATGSSGLAHRNSLGFTSVSPHAHNGYIDIWLYCGVFGFLVLIAIVWTMFSAAGRLARIPGGHGWLALTVIVFVALHNFLESDLMISSNPLSMLALLFLFIAIRADREHCASVRVEDWRP